MQRDADIFEIEGRMCADSATQSNVRVAYRASTAEKVFTINKKNITPRSSVIGKYPIVILSPEHSGITFGAPGERRTFMDFVLSQSSQTYLNDILAFRRIVKQRNTMLSEAKRERRSVDDSISSWNEQLVLYGAKVMKRRKIFIATFQEYVNATYRNIIDGEKNQHLHTRRRLNSQATQQRKKLLLCSILNLKNYFTANAAQELRSSVRTTMKWNCASTI